MVNICIRSHIQNTSELECQSMPFDLKVKHFKAAMHVLAFPPLDTMWGTCSLLEKKFDLVCGFSSCSDGSKEGTSQQKSTAEQSCLLHDRQEAQQKSAREEGARDPI